MDTLTVVQMLITVICSIAASSGFWAFIQNKRDKKDIRREMLVGLAHTRIIEMGMKYVERGYILEDEYEDLYEYLYKPYSAMGGNGSAERVMKEVQKLEIRKYHPHEERGSSK